MLRSRNVEGEPRTSFKYNDVLKLLNEDFELRNSTRPHSCLFVSSVHRRTGKSHVWRCCVLSTMYDTSLDAMTGFVVDGRSFRWHVDGSHGCHAARAGKVVALHSAMAVPAGPGHSLCDLPGS